jgi:predicted histidine transporter YuiF (NhaC family)
MKNNQLVMLFGLLHSVLNDGITSSRADHYKNQTAGNDEENNKPQSSQSKSQSSQNSVLCGIFVSFAVKK